VKALILAGGFGTRLRPLSCTRPKTLFPILNKPLLQWTLERLAEYKVTEAILAVNYQTEIAIKQRKVPKNGIHVIYSRDPINKPLGTGGPIKKAEKLIGHDEPFLVLNGDIFAEVDYAELVKLHEKKGATATIALHEVEDPSRYGVAELTKDNRIKRFIEKPPPREAPSNLINAGAYVLSPEIFKYIPKNQAVSFERKVFPELAKEGSFLGYVFTSRWTDIGKPEDYLQINKTLLDMYDDERQHLEMKMKGLVALDKGVTIGEGSVLGPYAVLGRNVSVGEKAHIQNSVVLQETVISDAALVNGAIIGEGVFIGKRARIGEECIIGDHAKVNDGVKLTRGVSVCPFKEVSESVLKPTCIS
jgi:mannose-1-phosphate guanylyltransferase